MSALWADAATAPLLQVNGVGKVFAGVPALSDVSLTLHAGEVHAVIGENGAGKSTLIHLLTGGLAADGGTMSLRGQAFTPPSPASAAAQGIAVLHQEPQLVPSLSALDNLFIGRSLPAAAHWGRWLTDRGAMRERAHQACEVLGAGLGAGASFNLPLDALVADLSATQRTQLALLRCLMSEPDLLVLDEPTASLTSTDAQQLMWQVDALRRRGKAVLYVSHRLDEVLHIADRITVLRNGVCVATLPARGQTSASLIATMSGKVDEQTDRENVSAVRSHSASHIAANAVLQVAQAATRDGRVRDASLTLHGGELLGIYGLAGSGRTELLELLMGLRAGSFASLCANGQPIKAHTAQAAKARAWVLIPEDRRGHALVLHMRLRDNLNLPFLRRFASLAWAPWAWLSKHRERAAAATSMRALAIKATGPEQSVVELSGGNQQKVVFARALAMNAQVLLCDEPTQAVDVGTRRAIHQLLRDHCARGGAALVVSSDLSEMLELAQRVVVVREGITVANLSGGDLNAVEVLRWCFAAPKTEAVSA